MRTTLTIRMRFSRSFRGSRPLALNALGTLADFVEVEPQYERLIESLFARELQSVLVRPLMTR